MKNLLLGLFVLSMVCGSATSSISIKEAQVVPVERVFCTEKLPIDGNGRAIFVRDTRLVGSGVYQQLFINGKKAAALNPGEKVEFVLAPGEYIFGAFPTDPFGTHALNTIDQDIKAGRNYFYRILTDGNSFRTSIQRYLPEAE